MIVIFRFTYEVKDMTEGQYVQLCPLLVGTERHAIPKSLEELKAATWQEYRGDIDALARVVPVSWLSLVDSDPGVTVWQELFRRFDELAARAQAPPAINERVRVVVPGLGLLSIERVMVLTDQCTESVQTYLTQGWRILAICPQPDQRRPDYVMGHSNVHEEY